MSCNTHVTLLTNLGQFRTCHIPCHTPWHQFHLRTHQPLKCCYHSFTLTPEIPGIQFCARTQVSPIPTSILPSQVQSQFQFLFLFLFLFLFHVLTQHSCVSLPVHTAFLCSDPYSDMFLFLMAMLSDSYIQTPTLYYIRYVQISTLIIVLIVYSTSL